MSQQSMSQWTAVHQQAWKTQLKLLIKEAGQTQVEVARKMAEHVADLENVSVSQNAFVTPLSRFVNAKGNEIERWFELTESRLTPLCLALGLPSPARLIRLRKEILFGKPEHPTHPMFPDVEWDLDWKIVDGDIHSVSQIVTACDLTKDLIRLRHPNLVCKQDRFYTNVQLPSWIEVYGQLSSALNPVQRRRLEALPPEIWSSMGFQFGDALLALYILLTDPDCWDATQERLSSEWVLTLRTAWIAKKIIEPCIEATGVGLEHARLAWEEVQKCLSRYPIDTVVERLPLTSQPSNRAFNRDWIANVQSKDRVMRQAAIRELEAWAHSIPVERLMEFFLQNIIVSEAASPIEIRSPLSFCCLSEQLLRSEYIDPYHSIWWAALWWAVQAHDWPTIQSVLERLDEWETASALCFLIHESQDLVSVSKAGLSIGTLFWSAEVIDKAWTFILLRRYSGFFEPMASFGRSGLLTRLHTLSKLLSPLVAQCDWRHLIDQTRWSFTQAHPQPLGYWSPYQVSIYSMEDWQNKQHQTGYPLWKVLEYRAHNGDLHSASLLAQGADLGWDVWLQVPVEVRLFWLSKVPASPKTLYLFQTMLVDYWQQPDPDVQFVLDIGSTIGFDTVLSWMQGWVNPLFLAQQESGLILGRVSFQFAEYFRRQDLIDVWTRMLWNWLRDGASLQEGFVHWNSRRVPIRGSLESLVSSVSDLLWLGLELCDQSVFMNQAYVDCIDNLDEQSPLQKKLGHILRDWKRQELSRGGSFFLERWIEQAPSVDLEVERAVLDSPDLLDRLWRLDVDGQRRSEIVRLAGLARPIPTWAIALAHQRIVETGYWPIWLSPHVKEASSLLSLMIETSQGGHRLWWLKIYSTHVGVSPAILRSLSQWLENPECLSERLQTVHFLGPNQTPKMTFGDVLTWILSLYHTSPRKFQSNPAQELLNVLKRIYEAHVSDFSTSELFALIALFSRVGFQSTLWSLEVLSNHWERMGADLKQLYRQHWLNGNPMFTNCDHPIVGEWVLERLLMEGAPLADEYLRTKVYAGDLAVLHLLLQTEHWSTKLMSLLQGFMENHKAVLVKDWVLKQPKLLQHPDPGWQRWLRQIVVAT